MKDHEPGLPLHAAGRQLQALLPLPCRTPFGLRVAGALALCCAMYLIRLGLYGLSPGGRDSSPSSHSRSGADVAAGQKPFFDLVAILYMTASEEDVQRLQTASRTWLAALPPESGLTFTYVGLVCADDPGVDRIFGMEHVAVVPCKHGYASLVTKGIEGYKFISQNFRFSYVLKTDVDTIVPLHCVASSIALVDKERCPSFAFARWYPPRTSKAWRMGDWPYGPKYHNEAYIADTGNTFYNPYPSGWAIVWSGDIPRFLGNFGVDSTRAPQWRRTWTIDDAAIGSFLVGLDICRLPMPCHTPSGVQAKDMQERNKVIDDNKAELSLNSVGGYDGFEGPYDDDVPGLGELGNLHASSVGNCGSRCAADPMCMSFEWSPSMDPMGDIRNCQLSAGKNRAGVPYGDFKLWVKHSDAAPLTQAAAQQLEEVVAR